MNKYTCITKKLFFIASLLSCPFAVQAQELSIEDHVIMTNDLNDSVISNYLSEKISGSQFIFIGEEHGYKENTEITHSLFNLAQPWGYNYLAIETDSIAAKYIEEHASAKHSVELAQQLNSEYPFSIPFYNSPDDYLLFKKVISTGGGIWGIDQAFMTQFRLNFTRLIGISKNNKPLNQKLIELQREANESFIKAIETRDFRAPFIFKYSDDLHGSLIGMCDAPEQSSILNQLKKSRDIYFYNFTNRQYLNNLHRSYLMKNNFLSYYRANQTDDKQPKVIFKLGANHAGRGINSTNVYDIANLVSELAYSNGMNSIHILLRGIKGQKLIGNPFSDNPVTTYDNSSDLPDEMLQLIKESDAKYCILDLTQIRERVHMVSDSLKEILFKFDMVILINDTGAIRTFD